MSTRFRPLLASLAALAVALAATSAGPAAAQNRPAQPPPDYAAQLTELAEVLGGAHYLRILCAGRGDQRWRDYMRGVIDREPAHRGALTEGFNRGYRDQEAQFPSCDRAASQTEAELRARGRRISDGLAARHAP